jgi:nucleotide-binding universal stress UspA family protein
MYERILVPLDGSAHSEEVLPIAAGIAQASGATLQVMRVILAADQGAEARDYLKRAADKYGAVALPPAESTGVAGSIIAEAERAPRALVAMTTHGLAGLRESILGSVALRVAQVLGRPLVLYRPRGGARREQFAVRNVVLALDGSDRAAEMEEPAAEMARWLGAGLTVVQAAEAESKVPAAVGTSDVIESSFVRSRAHGIADAYGVDVDFEVVHGDPARAISDYAREQEGVLLAMTSRGQGAVQRTVFGSVAAGCLQRSGAPVLLAISG